MSMAVGNGVKGATVFNHWLPWRWSSDVLTPQKWRLIVVSLSLLRSDALLVESILRRHPPGFRHQNLRTFKGLRQTGTDYEGIIMANGNYNIIFIYISYMLLSPSFNISLKIFVIHYKVD